VAHFQNYEWKLTAYIRPASLRWLLGMGCFQFGVYTWGIHGIGAKGADKILEIREAKGDLELEDLSQVPYLRLTPQLIKCLDFTRFS
jgi:hypothetical protein